MARKTKPTRRQPCAISACDRPAGTGRSGLCEACYQAAYYWKQRPVSRMVNYSREAAFRAARVQQFIKPFADVHPQPPSTKKPRRKK